jgi:hypothetical protein
MLQRLQYVAGICRAVVSPGLYLIALSVAAAGAAMVLAGRRKNVMRAIYKRLADARPEF